MKLYLISQDTNKGWDTFDCAVVCAESEKEARMIHPAVDTLMRRANTWDRPEFVDVKYIGVADNSIEKGVVCASFNAG